MEQLANIKTKGVSINAIVLKTLLIKFKLKTFVYIAQNLNKFNYNLKVE